MKKNMTQPPLIIKCSVCKDTGKMRYKNIEWAMYSWQPWLTKDCSYCNK